MRYHEILSEDQLELTAADRAWFHGSKILDDEGYGPGIVYHFTYNDFDVFDRHWATTRWKRNPERIDTIGLWFTDHPTAPYVNPAWGGKRIDVILKMMHPLYLHDEEGAGFIQLQKMVSDAGGSTACREELKQQGYDGIVMLNTALDGFNQTVMIVFEPDQIRKIATS